MNRDLIVKILACVSVIVFLFLALRYRTDYLIFFISLLSGIIQIVLFCLWYFEDKGVIGKVAIDLETVKEYVTEKDQGKLYREKVIRKIINKGHVDEAEISKLLSKLHKNDVIFISISECKLPKGLIINYGHYPLRYIVNNLGFIPVFFSRNPTLYFTLKEDLPKELRDIAQLEAFISKELSQVWDLVKVYANEKFAKFATKYEKWKTGTGFRASYIINKSYEKDFKIVYKIRHTFNEEFITKLLKEASSENIQKAMPDKVQVKEIISKMSIDIVLDTIENSQREAVLKNEKSIWDNMNIGSFLDFRNANVDKLKTELKKYISEESADMCAKIIVSECKKVYDEVDAMGLLLA